MPPRDKPEEPGADILPYTPAPALPGTSDAEPRTETEEIEEEGEPFGDNFA